MQQKHVKDMTKGELREALLETRDQARHYADGGMKAITLLFEVCGVLERIQNLVPEDHPERENLDFHLGHFRANQAANN